MNVLNLKPCPLCGKAVNLLKYREIIRCRIQCTGCGIEVNFKHGLDSKDVQKLWNKRAVSIS